MAHADTSTFDCRATRLRLLFTMCICVAAAAISGCGEPAITTLSHARRQTAELRVELANAIDAANIAVLADDAQNTTTLTREAERATQRVEAHFEALASQIQQLGLPDPATEVAAFREAFAKYRALNGQILALVLESSNFKAQALAFGPGQEAADALCTALDTLTAADAGADRARGVDALRARTAALTVIAAIRDIEVLEHPHIAAADDARMTELERQMDAREDEAERALSQLETLSTPETRGALSEAQAAHTRFRSVHTELIALSRRNTNLRSRALSIGAKRALAAECEGQLRTLGERLALLASPATR